MSGRQAKAARRNERGPIAPGDKQAARWTFTAERWEEKSYLWLKDGEITLSFVAAREHGKGYLRDLVLGIEAAGFRVSVPTPLARMETILRRWGWKMTPVYDEKFGENVEIWRRTDASIGPSTNR